MTEQTNWKAVALEMAEANELSWREIARQLGKGKSTVSDFLRKELKGDPQKTEEAAVEELCKSEDWHVANLAKRLRTAQRTNTQLRKIINGSADSVRHVPDLIRAVEVATSNINTFAPIEPRVYTESQKNKAIVEVLLSDYQIGKIAQHYNSHLAEKSMIKYGASVVKIVENTLENSQGEKIILAILGDIVEDHLKHGVQSAISTDCGLSEQMAKSIEHLWKYVLQPLAEFGVPVEVMCIAGNHGSSQHKGMDIYKAGLYAYDYVIYKALEGYCNAVGYTHVKFTIPEGMFGYTDIFGRYVVYSHGYNHGCTEKNLEDERAKRSSQLKRHVEYYRCGDMHHVCNYDNGKLVVNGAFFGVDSGGIEYSGVLGFSSIPAQVVMVHEDDKSLGRNTVKETHVIQVADGY